MDQIKKIKTDARGGKREGAGRKPGSKSRATATKARINAVNNAIVSRVSGEKLDPVEALMEMAEAALKDWRALGDVVAQSGAPDPEIVKARLQCGMIAADWFAKAAPYIRPRLAAVEAKVNVNVTIFERIERSRARVIDAIATAV